MKKKKQASPEIKLLLAELEDIVRRLGYNLRYEKGNFEGGYCLLKESRLFVINSKNEAEKRIAIIARNLKEIGIDDIFVKPQVREVIETENAKALRKEGEAQEEKETEEKESEEKEAEEKESEEKETEEEKKEEAGQ